MKKLSFICCCILLLFPVVYAEGSFSLNPREISQNDYLYITINPGSDGFFEFAYILDLSGSVKKTLHFRCDETDGEDDDKCFADKTLEVLMDLSPGNYLVYVYDYGLYRGIGGYATQGFAVVEGIPNVPNGPDEDNIDNNPMNNNPNNGDNGRSGNAGANGGSGNAGGNGGTGNNAPENGNLVIDDNSGSSGQGAEEAGGKRYVLIFFIVIVAIILAVALLIIRKINSRKN